MTRKPRPDDKLNVGPEKRDWLFKVMRQVPALSYDQIRDLVKREWGLATSNRALSKFWEEETDRENSERVIRSASAADVIGAKSDELNPKLAKALKTRLVQAAFDLSMSGGGLKDIQTLMSIVGGMDKAQLDSAALQLELEKFKNSLKTEQEKGLDALFVEIRNDPIAVDLFQKMKARVMQSFEGRK